MTTYTYDPIWWNRIKKDVVKDAFDIDKAVQQTLCGLTASQIGFFAKSAEPSKNQPIDPLVSKVMNKIPGKGCD